MSATSAAVPRHAAAVGTYDWRAMLAFATIGLLPLLLSLPFLSEPMDPDEGVYFSMALSGDLPYVDVFDHKPPLVYGWYKLALLVNGGDPSIETVRMLAALNLATAALAVTWLGTMLGGRKLGIIAGLLIASAASNQYLQANANTEVFLLPPLIMSLACFVHALRGGGARWYLLAGALCGIAAMTKSVAALNVAALAGLPFWAASMQKMRWSDARNASALVVLGGSAVAATVIAPFAISGHAGEFWYANVTYNLHYNAQYSLSAKVYALAEVDNRVLTGGLPVWVMGGIGAVLVFTRRIDLAWIAVLASAVAAFLGASVTGREYAHYWLPLVPFAALFGAAAIARLSESWESARHRLHLEALLIALAIPSILVVVPLYRMSPDEAHLHKFESKINARRAVENDEVAARVIALTRPGDRIFNFGLESQMSVLSGRRTATYYTRPLAAIEVEPGSFARTMRELRANPPALIVDSARIEIPASDSRGLDTLSFDVDARYRQPFQAFLAEHYEFAGRVAYADLYALK